MPKIKNIEVRIEGETLHFKDFVLIAMRPHRTDLETRALAQLKDRYPKTFYSLFEPLEIR